MKIAISADQKTGLEANVSEHFGRCAFYVLVDVEDKEIKKTQTVENPFFDSHGGPGEVPAFINEQKANVIMAGGMGGRAFTFFEQFNIEAVTGATGTVKEAVDKYLAGELKGNKPCAHNH
jgi:predicted Fe-Mo cluster-binding NifX family protein